MKYTYFLSIQGNDRSSHYLVMQFDRQLSGRSYYRDHDFSHPPALVKELMEALANTPNVIKGDYFNSEPRGSGGELIHVDGAEITVKIVPMHNVPEIAKQIAKKVQRRFAKGEGRKRIMLKELDDYAAALKAKTYGAA